MAHLNRGGAARSAAPPLALKEKGGAGEARVSDSAQRARSKTSCVSAWVSVCRRPLSRTNGG
jgi:hypothetical protein